MNRTRKNILMIIIAVLLAIGMGFTMHSAAGSLSKAPQMPPGMQNGQFQPPSQDNSSQDNSSQDHSSQDDSSQNNSDDQQAPNSNSGSSGSDNSQPNDSAVTHHTVLPQPAIPRTVLRMLPAAEHP